MSALREVVIDARCLGTGIGTYSLNLLEGLSSRPRDFDIRVITSEKSRNHIEQFCDRVSIVNSPIYSLSEQFTLPKAATGASLFHALHYNAPLFLRGRLVVTIYDLTHILDYSFRRTLKSWVYAQPMLRAVAGKANHIFTISKYSSKCISEVLHVNPDKISVTYPGVSSEFCSLDRSQCALRVSRALDVSSPFLLFVGNLKPHKNFLGLLSAFATLRKSGRIESSLVVVGDDVRGGMELRARIQQLSLSEHVVVIPRVAKSLLVDLYNSTDLLVLPSFEEGFGLPVLESLACGTPVACARAASLPEVGGSLAEYFDPYDQEDMVNAIERALCQKHRERIRLEGPMWSARFGWGSCVDHVCGTYERLVLG